MHRKPIIEPTQTDDPDLRELYLSTFREPRIKQLLDLESEETVYRNGELAWEVPKTSWSENHFSTIDRANFLAYLKQFSPWVKAWSESGQKKVVVPDSCLVGMPPGIWKSLIDAIEGVGENYPLLNDDIHSALERQLQDEAWESGERKEFRKFVKEHLEPYYDEKTDRDGVPMWDKVETLLDDDDDFVDHVFYDMCQAGNGDEWATNESGSTGLRHSFYTDLTRPRGPSGEAPIDHVKRMVDAKLWPESERQMHFNFAESIVDILLSERFGKTGGCSPAAHVLADSLMEGHSFSCVMAPLPEDLAKFIVAWGEQQIPEQSLFVDEDTKGREDEIHVTVKYGLSEPMPSEELLSLFRTTVPFDVSILPVSLFHNEKYDVVKLDVSSARLREFNVRVTEVTPCPGDSHPEYHPHITIAYVKKGTCDRLEGMSPWDSDVKMGVSEIAASGTFEADHVVFSSSVLGVKKVYHLGPTGKGAALKEGEEIPPEADDDMAIIKDLAHASGLFGQERPLRWLRRNVGQRVIKRVEISRIPEGSSAGWIEGVLRVYFDRGEVARTEFCSYEVLKCCIRQWRNIYGATLIVNGEPAGTVSYRNPALADTPVPPR